jgi:plastocyanin
VAPTSAAESTAAEHDPARLDLAVGERVTFVAR